MSFSSGSTRNSVPSADARRRKDSKLKKNTLVEGPPSVKLKCGHETTAHPVAIYPDRRKLFTCPEGCGLQKSVARG